MREQTHLMHNGFIVSSAIFFTEISPVTLRVPKHYGTEGLNTIEMLVCASASFEQMVSERKERARHD